MDGLLRIHILSYLLTTLLYYSQVFIQQAYSHLSNKRGGWNKRGGGAKVVKSINVEVEITVEAGIFLKNQ